MEPTFVTRQYQIIIDALSKNHIKIAFDSLSILTRQSHNNQLIDVHYNLETTYKNLLHYTVEGTIDPERKKILEQLKVSIFTLAEQAIDELLTSTSSHPSYEFRRTTRDWNNQLLDRQINEWQLTNQESLSPLQLVELKNRLFMLLWSTSIQKEEEKVKVQQLFDLGELWYHQACWISAITLNLSRLFQPQLVHLLMDLVNHADKRVAQRAMTGLIFVLMKYDARLSLYPSIVGRLKLLKDQPGFERKLINIAIQIIRTRETEKISAKFQNEILPEVVKIHPNLREKLDLDRLISDAQNEDKNPDWLSEITENTGLIDKLEEITKLQIEGADVFLSTFKYLKSFPFFNFMCNWFEPFYYTNPLLNDANKNNSSFFENNKFLESFEYSNSLCNSDKYSFILSIEQLPPMQKEAMKSMMGSELIEMSDIEKDEALTNPFKQEMAISNRYIQDLYRFFKIHPKKNMVEDPFEQSMNFHNKWFFNFIISGNDTLKQLADYLFEKEYFAEASDIYSLLSKQDVDIKIIQKEAYCYQKLEKYEKALNLYLQADLINHEQAWNLKKVALCYRHLRNTEKALEFYLEAEKHDADNLTTQASIGHCYLELEQYEKALKYYFKVEYLDTKNQRIWRPIAWCSFLVGKYDVAHKYYHQLLDKESSKHDLMNLAHVEWCMGNRKEAMKMYKKSIQSGGESIDSFINTFEQDVHHLVNAGILEDDIPILLDQLRYDVE